MCMAVSGGALVPLIMSKMVDLNMKSMSFVIPTVCFVYLFLLSLRGGKKPVVTADKARTRNGRFPWTDTGRPGPAE